MDLHGAIEKVLNEFIGATNEDLTDHPLSHFIRKEIPEIVYDTGVVNRNSYYVDASVGKGKWAQVPWVCVFDRAVTTSATKGVYIAYLFSKNGDSVYLTFNQGCTEIRNQHSKKETITIMHNNAKNIRKKINNREFIATGVANLGDGLSQRAEMYQEGTIFYKEYKKGQLPPESILKEDLKNMMDIYKDYVSGLSNNSKENVTVTDGSETELSPKENIKKITEYISSKGFKFDDGLIENYYLSLKSKPFVILAGTSGTGKTRLVRLFAEAIGSNSKNGRYKLVPVRPDWSDSTDLFGHVNLNDKFIPGAIIDFVKKAENDLNNPYFLCLDEMNLARVEYYLSDILSIIETRESVNDKIITDPLISDNYYGVDEDARVRYGEIRIPENLYIVGTVNMDETTFPFSKKVLDRANTIEFSKVELSADFGNTVRNATSMSLNNSFMKADYVFFTQCIDEKEFVEDVCNELETINKILSDANCHVGYRVRDEVVFYMLNNKNAELLERNKAFDYEILQKILPRIQGSSYSIKIMLCKLFEHCAGKYDKYQTEDDDVSSKMLKAAEQEGCKYKESAMKIAFMVKRFEEDGFTSYWL